jgi:hypothetical protein
MTWILLSDRDFSGSHIILTHEKTVYAVTVDDEILELRLKFDEDEKYGFSVFEVIKDYDNEKVEYNKIDKFVEKVETGIFKLVTTEYDKPYDKPSKAWNYDELAFSKFIEVKKDYTFNRYKYFDYTQDYLRRNHDKIEEVTEDYLKAGMIDAQEVLKEESNR